MRYYVVSDVHGFHSELIVALRDAGFFADVGEKKLIVCGDLMDRGQEAEKLQNFMLDLLKKDQLILIQGNHEDLMLCMLDDILDDLGPFLDMRSYHIRNGTLDTALQLAHFSLADFMDHPRDLVFKAKQTPFVKKLIPYGVNYFETENHIFVHGWIPCRVSKEYTWCGMRNHFDPVKDWRKAPNNQWREARWINGMEAATFGKIIEPNKTIVCGHWHCSYGHSVIDRKCAEHGSDAIRDPYYGDGVIGIDACTAVSRKINCIVIEEG